MEKETSTNFNDLPGHEQLRAIGQMTISAGMFLVAVSTVLKHLGNLPDTPITSTVFKEPPSTQQQNNNRGYFD